MKQLQQVRSSCIAYHSYYKKLPQEVEKNNLVICSSLPANTCFQGLRELETSLFFHTISQPIRLFLFIAKDFQMDDLTVKDNVNPFQMIKNSELITLRRKEGRPFWGYDLQCFFLQNPQTLEHLLNSLSYHNIGPNKLYALILSKSNLKRIHMLRTAWAE